MTDLKNDSSEYQSILLTDHNTIEVIKNVLKQNNIKPKDLTSIMILYDAEIKIDPNNINWNVDLTNQKLDENSLLDVYRKQTGYTFNFIPNEIYLSWIDANTNLYVRRRWDKFLNFENILVSLQNYCKKNKIKLIANFRFKNIKKTEDKEIIDQTKNQSTSIFKR